MFSAFNPSKCTHTWSSGQPGSSWGFGALLKGLASVVDNSCRSRDSNPQPRVTSPTLYPLGHDCHRHRQTHTPRQTQEHTHWVFLQLQIHCWPGGFLFIFLWRQIEYLSFCYMKVALNLSWKINWLVDCTKGTNMCNMCRASYTIII